MKYQLDVIINGKSEPKKWFESLQEATNSYEFACGYASSKAFNPHPLSTTKPLESPYGEVILSQEQSNQMETWQKDLYRFTFTSKKL